MCVVFNIKNDRWLIATEVLSQFNLSGSQFTTALHAALEMGVNNSDRLCFTNRLYESINGSQINSTSY